MKNIDPLFEIKHTKYMTKHLLGLFLFLFLQFNSFGQIGTEFWFAVPNIDNRHSAGDDTQELRLASFNTTPVSVTIDIPANSSFTPVNLTIPAGGTFLYTFNKADVEIPLNNTVSNTGLRIRANAPITAYYEIGRNTNNTEVFSLKGDNAVGTSFYVPMQNVFNTDSRFYDTDPNSGFFPGAQSSINIVAVEDNTSVTITLQPGKRAAGWGSSETRTITLNRGQTYSVASASLLGADRITGTRIVANRNIAVTMADDSPDVNGGADLAGDQLVPISVVGTEYLIPPGRLNYDPDDTGPLTGSNIAFVVATQDNTSISVNGTNVATGLNAGQTFRYVMPNPPSNESRFLSASSPVYVLYYSGFGTESGSPLLPTIKCTGSTRVSFVRSTDQNFFLTVLAQDAAIGNFTFEGSTTVQNALNNPANYFDNPSFPGWRVLQREFTSTADIPSNTAITVSNSAAYFHMGFINGIEGGGSARFAYFSDYGILDSDLPSQLSLCPNTTITLDPKILGIDNSKTTWRRNGTILNITPVNGAITFPVPADNDNIPDNYTVELVDNRECRFNDNVRITVFPEPNIALNIKNNGNICNNDNSAIISINAAPCNSCSYIWSRESAPNSNSFNNFTASLPPDRHLPNTGGRYRVIASDANACRDTAFTNIVYNTAVLGTFNKPTAAVCSNQIPTFEASALPPAATNYNFKTYSWRFNGTEFWTQRTYTPQANNGNYSLTVTDQNDCVSSDNVNINFVNPASVSLTSPGQNICSDQNTVPITMSTTAPSLQSLTWLLDNNTIQTGVNNRSWLPNAAGTYRVNIVDNNSCQAFAITKIDKFSNTVRVVLNNPPSVVCSNAGFELSHATPSVVPNFKSYQWSLGVNTISGATASTYRPTQTGTYTLRVIDENDCPSSDSKTVNWTIAQTFSLGSDQNAPICTNGNYLITVPNNFNSLIWSLNNNIFTPSSGSGGRTHKPLIGQSGNIEVRAKDPNGCDASDVVFIDRVVDPTPISLNTPPNNVCSNAGFVLSASPANFPTYTWLLGTNPAPNASNSPNYIPRSSGRFNLNAIDLNGCNTSTGVDVNFVDTLPLNINTPPNVFCANNTSYRITPSGGSFVSYEFRRNNQVISPISGPGIQHRPSLGGNYQVIATDSRGCISRRSVDINFQDTANFALPALPTVICENANGFNTTTLINATGPYVNYVWRLNGNVITPNVSASIHRPTVQGTYRVTVTDANTCTASASVFANYFVPQTLRLTSNPNGNIACWNTNYTLTPTAGFTTYEWTATTSPAISIPINTFAYKPDRSGKYRVVGTDANTCKSADSVTITYVQDFQLDLGGTKAVCEDFAFTINAAKPNIVSYVWSNTGGLPNPSTSSPTFTIPIPPNSSTSYAGKYAVRLTDNNGCTDQDTLDFQVVTELPLELGADRIACSYEGFEVDATPNYANYVWTNTAGLPNPTNRVSKFPALATGQYKVFVTDASGLCTATDSIFITYVPDLGFELNNNQSDTICFNDLFPSRFILAKDSLKFTDASFNWSWSVPNGEAAPGNAVRVRPSTSGRYIATVQNKTNLCFDSDTTDVSFSRLLENFDLGKPDDTVCVFENDSITSTLPEYRSSQFIWAWNVPNSFPNPGLASVAYPNVTGKYKATITDRFLCKASDSVNVQFSDSLLTFDLGGPVDTICFSGPGQGKIIKATDIRYDNLINYTWEWTVPTGETNPGNASQINPTRSGNYSVRITDRWGCKTNDVKNISFFNDLFGFKITVPNTIICHNAPIELRTLKPNDDKYNNLNIYQWTWTVPTNSKINDLDSNLVVVDTSGKYKAVILNKNTKCDNRDSITVLYSDSLLALEFKKQFDTVCFNNSPDIEEIRATNPRYDNTNNYTWKWSTPRSINLGNVSSVMPDTSGTYSALVKDIYGCEVIANAQITFDNSLQDLDLGNAIDTVCGLNPKTITDERYTSNAFIWVWNLPKNRLSSENRIIPDTTGLYKATVSNRFRCANADSVQVIFSDSLLAFRLNKPSDTICFNDILLEKSLTSSENRYKNLQIYKWEWRILPSTEVLGSDSSFVATRSGIYEATIYDLWKCEAKSSTTVNFSNDLQGFDLGDPKDTICFNRPVSITSTSEKYRGIDYTWDWSARPNNVSLPVAGAKSYQPTMSGMYIVSIKNLENCTNKDSVDVTFSNDLEDFDLGNPFDTVCHNQPSDTLEATDSKYNNLADFTWQWTRIESNESFGNLSKIFPRRDGTYRAVVTDKYLCSATDQKVVSYGTLQVLGLGGDDTTACFYTNYNIVVPSGFEKYEWYLETNERLLLPSLSGNSIRPNQSGKYIVVATDRLLCTNSDSVNVLYVPPIQTNIPRRYTVCENAFNPLVKARGGFDSYQWNDQLASLDSVYKFTFPIFQGLSKVETLKLMVTKDICSAIDSTIVTYINVDDYVPFDTTVCLDKFVTFKIEGSINSFRWRRQGFDGVIGTGASLVTNIPDNYVVDVNSNCLATTIEFNLFNFDSIKYALISDKVLCIGENLDVRDSIANISNRYTYSWLEKNTNTVFLDTTSSINVEKEGNYVVRIKDIHNCFVTDSVQVTMTDDCFTIPNLFTPNNDAYNQTFFIRGIYKGEWALEVYNRWGDRVYYNQKYNNDWQGDNVDAGVFYYELKHPQKGKKYKGWVQIIR
jgi:gliding motility-associated-like protein